MLHNIQAFPRREEELLNSNTKPERALAFRFIDVDSKVHLELMNTTDQTLQCIEVLTVFLKDEVTLGGPSQAHIRFEAIKALQPQEKAVMPHRTWVDGKPVASDQDQLGRLKLIAGRSNPYVLDLSWQDAEGKTRYQRIPVGH